MPAFTRMQTTDLDSELAAVLRCVRSAPGRISVLSAADPGKRGRSALRIDLEDGTTVKVRRLESAEAAMGLVRAREALDATYSRVLGWSGAAIVEEWIAGTPLDELGADGSHTAAAGLVLGRLHAARGHGEESAATTPFCEAALADLQSCVSEGVLDPDEHQGLVALVHASDPGRTALTLTHRDFCAENILVEESGTLRVVDNEWFAVGPPGFDLGRTRARWPMSADSWARFLAAYRTVSAIDDLSLRFWSVAAAAWTLRLRLGREPASFEQPLCLLRSLERGL